MGGDCEKYGHVWAKTGLYDSGQMCIPCLRADCEGYVRQIDGQWIYVPKGFGLNPDGIALDIEDDPTGGVAKIVCREITHSYQLPRIGMNPGAVMIDIGAHVGVVSIWAAKKWPGIKVYAYEPLTANYKRLLRNMAANRVTNIKAYNAAVSGDGRPVTIVGATNENSGGCSTQYVSDNGEPTEKHVSTTLERIFEDNHIDRCRLLKIDCEGAEYEILEAGEKWLDKVDYFVGEFHANPRLKRKDWKELAELVKRHIPLERIRVAVG